MASTTQSFCNQAFPGPSPRPSLLWDSADFSLVKAASLPVSVWFFCIVMWKQKQISSFHRGAWTTVTKKPQLPGTQEPPAPDGGRRDSGFQTRLMLAPEHTTVFLKTAVANTQDYKQIFSQLHPFMFYIKAVFTEGHTVVVFVQGQLCFSLRKQAREGVNKHREWGCRLAEPSLWSVSADRNGSAHQ